MLLEYLLAKKNINITKLSNPHAHNNKLLEKKPNPKAYLLTETPDRDAVRTKVRIATAREPIKYHFGVSFLFLLFAIGWCYELIIYKSLSNLIGKLLILSPEK